MECIQQVSCLISINNQGIWHQKERCNYMRNFAKLSLMCIICLFSLAQATQAQPGGPRPGGPRPPGNDGGPTGRYHEVVQSDRTITLVPATVVPSLPSQVQIRIEGDWRIIESNGIPEHNTGSFPNAGNPNAISAQNHRYTVPVQPELSGQFTPAIARAVGSTRRCLAPLRSD